MRKELKYYKTLKGKAPFIEWLSALKDRKARAKIESRLIRLSLGHYGDCKNIGEGVSELRIHQSPGYRIYYADIQETIILLLVGGAKSTQSKDIKKAQTYLKDFKEKNL